MSLSRAELQAMDRDELVREVKGMDDRLAHMQKFVYERLLARLNDLDAENDRLRNRVAELEGRVTPDPAGKDYAELTRDEKVHRIRVALVRKAKDNCGAASMK